MEILSFLITIVVGFLGIALVGSALNWPDAGAVFAIATMGSIILWTILHPQKKQDEED